MCKTKPEESAMSQVNGQVVKEKNENGLHFFTINLDADQDGNGVSPWAVVGIMIATVIGLYVIWKLWRCINCRYHKKHGHHGVHLPMVKFESRNPKNEDERPKGQHDDRIC